VNKFTVYCQPEKLFAHRLKPLFQNGFFQIEPKRHGISNSGKFSG